jgi:hypothetical protein
MHNNQQNSIGGLTPLFRDRVGSSSATIKASSSSLPLPTAVQLSSSFEPRHNYSNKRKRRRSMVMAIGGTRLLVSFMAFGVIGLATFSSIAILLAQQQSLRQLSVTAATTTTTTTHQQRQQDHAAVAALRQFRQQHADAADNAPVTTTAKLRPCPSSSSSQQQQPLPALLLPREAQRGSWIGDVWIPPRGWELYSSDQLTQLWGHHTNGILWIGDSTGRRTSLTLWEILHGSASSSAGGNNGTDNDNNNTNNHTNVDIRKDLLEANDHINVNHKGHALEKCHAWPRIKGADICRTLSLPVVSSSSEDVVVAGDVSPPLLRTKSRPFVFKRLNCYHEVTEFLRTELSHPDSVLHHVDTIVLALGLWDITMEHQCAETMPAADDAASVPPPLMPPTRDRQQELLNVLHDEMPARFQILWRTTSYANREDAPAIDLYNQYAMDVMDDWMTMTTIPNISTTGSSGTVEMGRRGIAAKGDVSPKQKQQYPTVQYVDFARAIRPRSFGKDRIVGDHYAHYGSTARVVMIQMLSNLLAALHAPSLSSPVQC